MTLDDGRDTGPPDDGGPGPEPGDATTTTAKRVDTEKRTACSSLLTVPDIAPDADKLTAALNYAAAGCYVLPVKRGTKKPGSVVGNGWQHKSSRDPQQIAAWFAGTDHDIALHCGRSGFLVFDVDSPEKVPDVLARRLRYAPCQSTRPGVPGPGHYIFAMPPGRTLGNGTGGLGGGWGEVRGHNGVIIVANSFHCDGGQYRWRRTGVVPVLPDEIAELLPDGNTAEDAATDANVAAFLAEHTDATRPEILAGWVNALQNHFETSSRHNGAVSVTVGALKEARAGYFPAQVAIDTLMAMFITAATRPPTGNEKQRTEIQARDEYQGIVSWSVAQANAVDLDEVRARTEAKMSNGVEFDFTKIGTNEQPKAHDYGALVTLADIENGFWERESLHTIYNAALARMCSPWAVLAHTAARALALVRPTVTLPALIGGPGSLNWFAAVAAISGGGKGSASALARHLVPLHGVPQRNLGSGEGMIAAYLVPANDEFPEGVRTSILFNADEIDTVTALGSRTGSTTMSVLRAGFSGETLGHSYVSHDKNRHLPAGSYRMVVVFSVQPARAGALLGDHGGGTPQRFHWFPGTDARVTVDPPHWTNSPLALPNYLELARSREIIIPNAARKLILSERVKAMRGEADALDGHALFVREKFAVALAVLDGRVEMTAGDWELSSIAAQVSTHTRNWVAERLAEAQAEDAARLGTLRGITNQAADEEKTFRANQRASRVAAWILKQLSESGDGISEGELRRQAYSRDRSLITTILSQLASTKVIKHVAGKWVKVKA